ncbi:hypothetical protein BGZ94_006423 [Podila epigama]|nr:hypothetical protein BGZ94_006423 [Podila epigama]
MKFLKPGYSTQRRKSEAKIAQSWEDLLKVFWTGSPVRMVSGETILRSSRRCQERMNLLLDSDSSTTGRKCDLLVYCGKLELANYEFKAEGSTAAILESQRSLGRAA